MLAVGVGGLEIAGGMASGKCFLTVPRVVRVNLEGRLAPCPGSPNCVSSETTNEQRVEPLPYDGDAARARIRLLEVLNGMERTRVVQSTGDYVHVEVHSAIFGFVDDVEFYFSPPGIIQVRSASRTGYYDFGVNRERVETLRARFTATAEAGGTAAR